MHEESEENNMVSSLNMMRQVGDVRANSDHDACGVTCCDDVHLQTLACLMTISLPSEAVYDGRYEPAIALLLEVVQTSPNLPDPYHTLGLLYEQVTILLH